jgi:hypothetical protein
MSGVPASEDECDQAAFGQSRQRAGTVPRGIVLVMGRQRRSDAMVVEQPASDASVFACNQVGRRARPSTRSVMSRNFDQVATMCSPPASAGGSIDRPSITYRAVRGGVVV